MKAKKKKLNNQRPTVLVSPLQLGTLSLILSTSDEYIRTITRKDPKSTAYNHCSSGVRRGIRGAYALSTTCRLGNDFIIYFNFFMCIIRNPRVRVCGPCKCSTTDKERGIGLSPEKTFPNAYCGGKKAFVRCNCRA